MASITIRDLPDSMLEKVRILSKRNRRSMNSELLTLIERSLGEESSHRGGSKAISLETQIEMWRMLSGRWEDARNTEEIIKEIYDQRTEGRTVNL